MKYSRSGAIDLDEKPIALACKGVHDIAGFVEKAKKSSKGDSFILLLDKSSVKPDRLLPAYINALVRQRDGIARSNSIGMEMLLLVSGDTNIKKAISTCGAKDDREFIAFSDDKVMLRRFLKENHIKVDETLNLKLDLDVAGDVAVIELLED